LSEAFFSTIKNKKVFGDGTLKWDALYIQDGAITLSTLNITAIFRDENIVITKVVGHQEDYHIC